MTVDVSDRPPRRRLIGVPRNISMASWLAVAVLIVTVTSLVVTSFLSLTYGQDLADGLIDSQLQGRASVKADAIARYVNSMRARTAAIATSRGTLEAAERFNLAYADLGTLESSVVDEASDIVDSFYRDGFAPALEDAVGISVGWRSLVPVDDAAVYLQRHYVAGSEAAGDTLIDDAGDGSSWSEAHRDLHLRLLEIADRLGAADLYLIDPSTGAIVYSAAKEVDFATSLDTGPHGGTTLAAAMRRVRESPVIGTVTVVDMAPYAPDLGAPMLFMASPVLNGERLVGILVLKIPGQPIDSIMTSDQSWLKEGFGETGEAYLVGSDGRMRSVARPFVEDPDSFLLDLKTAGTASKAERGAIVGVGTTSVFLKVADARDLANAATAQDTTETTNYLQRTVLTAVESLDVGEFEWFVIAEAQEEEINGPIGDFRRALLIAVAVFVIGITFWTVAWARAMFRPVRAISEKLRQIRDGEPVEESELVGRAPSDFTDLAHSIDQMLEALNRREADLAAASEERLSTVRSLLPVAIAERVERGDRHIIDQIPQAGIVVIVIEGLGDLVRGQDAVRTRELLDQLVNGIDAAAIHHGLERVKMLGDAYYAGCGLTQPYLDHVPRSVAFALDVRDAVAELNSTFGTLLRVAAGIQSGPVTVGLAGSMRLVYDLWGDTLNVAHFLARLAQPGEILASGEVRSLLPSDVEVVPKPRDGDTPPVFEILGHRVPEDAQS